MSREVHVRFCERPGVKFLRPTHPYVRLSEEFMLSGRDIGRLQSEGDWLGGPRPAKVTFARQLVLEAL